MAPSDYTQGLRRTGDILREGVSSQVEDYSDRFSVIANLHDQFLCEVIRTHFPGDLSSIAEEFLGSAEVEFAAVDGTMYTDRMFDLVVFYGGSYASRGFIDFSEDPPRMELSSRIVEEGVGPGTQ